MSGKNQKFSKTKNLQNSKKACINRDSMGNLLKPDRLTHRFKSIIRKHGMKEIRFHDLRHSCASLLYSQGVDLKQIQAWLGHSTIGTTANIYTHFDYSKKVESANAILSVFGGMQEGCLRNFTK